MEGSVLGSAGSACWGLYPSRDGTTIKLKRITKKAHPNMFELVEFFEQEQSDTEVNIAQLDTGSQPPKSAKKSVDKDKKIRERFSQDRPD